MIGMESCLVGNFVHEAFQCLRGWCKKRTGHNLDSKPLYVDMEQIRSTYQHLYKIHPPEGDPLPINVTPYSIKDDPPDEDELLKALRYMRRNRTPGPSGMTVEDIIYWNHKHPEAWAMVSMLVRAAMQGEDIPLAFSRMILCLLPKAEAGKYRAIQLLETLCKLCTTVIHLRWKEAITFHPDIHGFIQHRGTGTAILEAKLGMQLAWNDNVPYFQLFLDVAKAYDLLNRNRTLDVLKARGVGPHTLEFLRINWERSMMFPRSNGYYGKPIHSECGTYQGDVLSPLLFDIILDCILREWHRQMRELARKQIDMDLLFYADDGRLSGRHHKDLQIGLDLLRSLFRRIGLDFNVSKTKAMMSIGAPPPGLQSPVAYKRRCDDSLPSHRERKLAKVVCSHEGCGKAVSSQYLPTHMRNVHGVIETPKVKADHLPPELISPPAGKHARTDPTIGHSPSDPLSLFPPRSLAESHYQISFPSGCSSIKCPVDDCLASLVDRGKLRRHFACRHPFDSICILEEGLLPQCRCCGIRMHLKPSHYSTKFCKMLTRQRLGWAKALRQLQASNVKFHVGNAIIENVSEFKYLGRILHYADLDDAAVLLNLQKARKTWCRIHRILRADGCSPHVMAYFYKTIIQSTLLFGSESWVLSQRLRKRLNSFHLRCARQIAHRPIRHLPSGEWECPDSAEVLEICKMSTISTYIAKRRTSLLRNYAVPSSELCKRCLQVSSSLTSRRLCWWNG